MQIAWGNQRQTGLNQIAVFGFFDIDGAASIEPAGKSAGEFFRHVLDDENGGALSGQGLQHFAQGLRSSSRSADGDDRGSDRHARNQAGFPRVGKGRNDGVSAEFGFDFEFGLCAQDRR